PISRSDSPGRNSSSSKTAGTANRRWCSPPRSPIHPSYHFATVSQLVRAPGLRFRTLRPTCASPSAGATRERDESRQRPQKAATAPYAGAQGRSLKRGGIAGGGCNWMTARQARRGRGTLPPNQLRRGGTLTFRQCYAASLIHIRGSPLREASELESQACRRYNDTQRDA